MMNRYSKACHEATLQLADLIKQLLVHSKPAQSAPAARSFWSFGRS